MATRISGRNRNERIELPPESALAKMVVARVDGISACDPTAATGLTWRCRHLTAQLLSKLSAPDVEYVAAERIERAVCDGNSHALHQVNRPRHVVNR